MRLERASYKAIKYACSHFHYAKRLPAQPMIGFSVFEDDSWCGVIVFNAGIGNINKPYELNKGEVAELVRVALNGKQSQTSKALSIALKLFRNQNPLCKLVVSYADSDENHIGVIYQATNWFFVSSHKTGDKFIDCNGKEIHSRSHSPTGYNIQFGVRKRVVKTSDLTRVKKGVKHKYIYPLRKELIPLCRSLAKPYPKKQAQEVLQAAHLATSQEEGFDSTPALKLQK